MVSLVLPNQLFREPPTDDTVLYEHPHYFTRLSFHKQKLMLHRASMKAYQEKTGGRYLEYSDDIETVFKNNDKVDMYNPVNHEVKQQIKELGKKHGAEIVFHETPGFLVSDEFNRKYFEQNSYYQSSYYQHMRKKFDVLVKDGDKPVGGKWSFDPENRKKMPEDMETPTIPKFSSEHVDEAREYIETNFGSNYGETQEFSWPVTREQARENLEDFLENRLEKFGDYQDAFDEELEFGFHSLLSSSINTGLLHPKYVIDRTLQKHEDKDYPLNSLEGFLRQVLGWREFMRAMYTLEPEMADANFWDADSELPQQFYTAETGFPPVDDSITHAIENAYCHHIERLMVLGNMMLLLEIDPDQVYDWFMEMFIDSYDWVMIPNVYGMSQYSYTNMVTKPYISSSNYIHKQSHYGSGKWEEQWDGLYWNFIKQHEDKISDIQRMSFMTSTLNRMNEDTVEEHVENAQKAKKELGILE
jgi:deoxyribodipyrimidine photolyase-related protein